MNNSRVCFNSTSFSFGSRSSIANVSNSMPRNVKISVDSLRQLQSLIGLLNVACQVVSPGRSFCRRLIDATCNIRKPHHRIRESKSMREDIKVWLTFLSEYNGVTVITDNAWASNETLKLFTTREFCDEVFLYYMSHQ
jgi:hypothetical protein